MQSHNNQRKRCRARVASRDQRKQTQTQSSHSVSIYRPLRLLSEIVCQSRLIIETQPNHTQDREILFQLSWQWKYCSTITRGMPCTAPTLIRTTTTSDNVISRYTYCPCSLLLPRLIAGITTARQNTKALFWIGFQLTCDSSVVTDDRAVKHPRELQSKLIDCREIEHDLKTKDLLLEINAILLHYKRQNKSKSLMSDFETVYMFIAYMVKRTAKQHIFQ